MKRWLRVALVASIGTLASLLSSFVLDTASLGTYVSEWLQAVRIAAPLISGLVAIAMAISIGQDNFSAATRGGTVPPR